MICAIDPGPTESAFALIAGDTCRPLNIGKVANADLISSIPVAGQLAIEMVASYGMAVGADVFQTVRWIGRFEQALVARGDSPVLVYRRDVKLHHCHSAKAKDANITQALIDRFASGQPNQGKGTKSEPGWFYGFAGDVWAAYAVAVYVADVAAGIERP